jgi:hypothetical protein
LAPKAFIEGEMKRQLDPNDPESVFWNAALEASGAYQAGKRESGTPFDDNPNVTVLLTALAKGMTYGLNDAVEALRRQSGGEVPLSTLLSTLREQLIANIKQATHEHLEAMDQIRQSRTLNPRQKEILRLYAEPPVDGSQRPRRLDFVQLRLYEAIANTIASRLPRLHEAAERGDPATLYDCVSDIRDAFLPGFMEIVKHAGEMRASGDLTDETDQGRLFELCLNLALAKHHAPPPLQAAGSRPGTPSASPQVPRKVSAMQAANRSGAPSTPGKRPAGSRASEIETGAASTSTRPAALPDPLAAEAPPEDDGRGEFVDAPRQFSIACELSPLNGVVRAGTLYEALMGISSGIRVASVRDGDWEPLYRMRPELLVRTLADPKCCAAELEADEPGVFADPSFGNPIAPDYNPAAVFDPARHSVSLGQLELPPAHVPDTLRQVLGRADIILNGRRLTPDPADRENPAKRAIEAFGGTFAPDGDEVGAAVAAVAASDALQNFATDIEQAAFAPPASLEPQREVHEIWQDRDGSWLVRSTRVSHPTAQGGRPLDTDGVVLCTMTHRIAPPGEPGAQPGGAAARVELVDQPRAVIMLSEPKRAPAD